MALHLGAHRVQLAAEATKPEGGVDRRRHDEEGRDASEEDELGGHVHAPDANTLPSPFRLNRRELLVGQVEVDHAGSAFTEGQLHDVQRLQVCVSAAQHLEDRLDGGVATGGPNLHLTLAVDEDDDGVQRKVLDGDLVTAKLISHLVEHGVNVLDGDSDHPTDAVLKVTYTVRGLHIEGPVRLTDVSGRVIWAGEASSLPFSHSASTSFAEAVALKVEDYLFKQQQQQR